jgi:chemotaxis protein CheX
MSVALSPEDVEQVTKTVWMALVEEELVPASEEQSTLSGRFLTGCVQITGEWEGAIVVSCSYNLAMSTTAFMFDMGVDEVTREELQDAVGELANMVGGSLKGLVPGPSRLSLPTVVDGSDYSTKIPGAKQEVQAALVSSGEPLIVTVMRRVS